ncbi:hypothetical protein [Streptomyces sp. NPDC019224]|uniref:hypothetical protein n=1 Tax=Streptomyces sp. NPDC019224 TaxID=3154484 RepID=UPI0033F727A1
MGTVCLPAFREAARIHDLPGTNAPGRSAGEGRAGLTGRLRGDARGDGRVRGEGLQAGDQSPAASPGPGGVVRAEHDAEAARPTR